MFVVNTSPMPQKSINFIHSCINDGKNVLICIKNTTQPSSKELELNLKKEFWRYLTDEKIKIIIAPDIESVYFEEKI
jgi:hypothetical protein